MEKFNIKKANRGKFFEISQFKVSVRDVTICVQIKMIKCWVISDVIE